MIDYPSRSAGPHLVAGANTPKSIGVLIASYRRPACLLACLQSLAQQSRLPDEVIVVLRKGDAESREALRAAPVSLPLKIVEVAIPGSVAARNAGIPVCVSDVLAMLDDDTQPQREWLERVLRRFVEDPALGGLGGRDRCFDGKQFDERQEEVVGKIQWFGRMIGNHHLGFGTIREVDFLKGANMSYRAACFAELRFDSRLKGTGAQPREDTTFSVAVKAAGWKLAYDPAAVVDHYAAEREEERHYVDVRALSDTRPFREFAYNDALCIWRALSVPRKAAFIVWSFLVGTRVCPGLIQAVRFTPKLGRGSWQRFYVAQQGKLGAFRSLVAS